MLKKIAVLCLPWVLAACATMPATGPTQPTPKLPQPKPASIDSAAQAPSAVVSLLERAEQQENKGDNSAAASTLERAIRIAPRYPESYYRLGELRYKQGSYSQARSLAQKALSLGADGWLGWQAKKLAERAAEH